MAAEGKRAGRRPLVWRGVELACTSRYEDEARAAGHRLVAGVDEVGRGALCGPVVACAVVLDDGFDTTGVDDSKRLTALQREKLAARVRGACTGWGLGVAEPEEIDRVNVLRATLLAMRRAIDALPCRPDVVLVDALTLPGLDIPQRSIVKGDALSVTIAAAAVVAKVERDSRMRALDERYPGFGLARNMGYGSGRHREALRRLGPTEIHRRSFQGTQRWLF
jgi:ribonuclease HII